MRRLGKVSFARKSAIAVARSQLRSLLNQRVDLTWLNSSLGTRKSIYQGIADRAENGLDIWTSAAGEEIIGCMDGYTNLVPADLLSWDESVAGTGSIIATQDLVECTHAVGGDRAHISYSAQVTSGLSYTATFRVVSNTISTSGISIVKAGVGGVFTKNIPSLTTGVFSLTFTANATGLAEYRFGPGAGGANGVGGMEFECIRVVQATSLYPALVDGSAAGKTVATDRVSASPVWTPEGTLVVTSILYGWPVTKNPATPSPRFFDIDNGSSFYAYANPLTGDVRLGIGASINIVSVNESIVDGVNVFSFDYDGINVGIRLNESSRSSVGNVNALSGPIAQGNRIAGDRPWHGPCRLSGWNFKLTDYQYNLYRQFEIAQFGTVGSIFQ